MATEEKNFADMPVAEIPVDSEYRRCNFSRKQPDTSGASVVGHRLFPGDDTPRTFIECNLMNCEPPPGSTLVKCNTWIIETLQPSYTEDLVIDGVVEDTQQFYERTVHGKYDADAGDYDRTGYPQTMPENVV